MVAGAAARQTEEAGVDAGAAARQIEERKHTSDDPICSELGWKCVPLVVETFGAWGRTAGQFFAQLAVRLAAQRLPCMLNSIYMADRVSR